jgi:putative ABC transport system permease protein
MDASIKIVSAKPLKDDVCTKTLKRKLLELRILEDRHTKPLFMVYLRSVWEGVKIAFTAIRANKVRAFLTMFGIIIGIVAVTAMNTTINGVNRSFEDSMAMLGTNVLYVEKFPWDPGPNYKWWLYINRPEMEVEYAEKIKQYSSYVSAASAVARRTVTVRATDKYANGVTVSGVSTDYSLTNTIDLEDGRFFTFEENQSSKRVAIIGASVEEVLFPQGNSIGKSVRIGGQRFEVVGKLAKQGNFLGMQNFDNQILIPISAYGRIYGLRRGVSLQIKYDDEKSLQAGEYELEGIMRRVRQLDAKAENNFAINKLDVFRQQYQMMTGAIYGIGIFLTGLSLFVGGIGVMNIMYVSVKERTKEIGIRKAVGAKSYQILLQFLIEAVTVCCLGGAVGVLISVGVTQLINQFFVAYMDWGTVVGAFLICTAVGVLFGYLPARRAAHSNPIESLRYE